MKCRVMWSKVVNNILHCNVFIWREAYAVLVATKRYRSWIFGTHVMVYSDHNPLQYLIESAPKSTKLMRWSLSLQEFSLTFKYKSGKTHAAADCLSRL